jgi:hypothetical protein
MIARPNLNPARAAVYADLRIKKKTPAQKPRERMKPWAFL